jgi:Hsp20/alpha crystallin family
MMDTEQYRDTLFGSKNKRNNLFFSNRLIDALFCFRYTLPKEYDMNAVHSSLSSDGILTIKAPPPAIKSAGEKHVPIAHSGVPAHLSVKNQVSRNGSPAQQAKSPALQK